MEIDITPSSLIYTIFKNFNYKPIDAIAEFIDNSTQSFKDQQNFSNKQVPLIFIIAIKSEKKLIILDNCFGVKEENIERILKLNIPIKNNKSRNEYGMGIKTAGFWLGDKITITSKHINSNNTIKINLDLKELEQIEKTKNNKVEVELLEPNYLKEICPFDYGTQVEIYNVEKFNFTIRQLNQIAKKFCSKYRDDFTKDKLQIKIVLLEKDGNWHDCFTKEPIDQIGDAKELNFEPPILKKDHESNEIKNDIDKVFEFENKKYKIKGWIGVLEKGSRNQPGLTLFRRGRTIKGDDVENEYKPKEIYGDAGTFEWQRITGWLYLDDFPVTQQKNDFAWTGGLEEEFIKIIKNEVENGKYNLRNIAKLTKDKESRIETNDLMSKKVSKELEESLSKDNYFQFVESTTIETDDNEKAFMFKLQDDKNNIFILELKLTKKNNEQWLSLEKNEKNQWKGTLNFSLPWFSPFNNELSNIKEQIIKFAVYFSYAEWVHSNSSCMISHNFRETLNKCFSNNNIVKEITKQND